MAIQKTGVNSSLSDTSSVDTGNTLSVTLVVGSLTIVAVIRTTGGTFGTVTDNGAGGGNTYTLQAVYNTTAPYIAIYTSFTTVSATILTFTWGAGSTTDIVVTPGIINVASIGSSGFSSGIGTTETITAALSAPTSWGWSCLSHLFTGGSPTNTVGQRLTGNAPSAGNTYSSFVFNQGSTSVTMTDTYGSSSVYSGLYIELIAAPNSTQVLVQFAGQNAYSNSSGNSANISTTINLGTITTVGALLVCVVQGQIQNGSTFDHAFYTLNPPTTPGITWVLAGTITWTDYYTTGNYGSLSVQGAVAVYFALNAPSMSQRTLTTASGSMLILGSSAPAYTIEVTVNVIEVSFPAVPAIGSINGVDVSTVGSMNFGQEAQTGTPISAGNLNLSSTDFVVVGISAMLGVLGGSSMGSGPAGSGWTRLINDGVNAGASAYASANKTGTINTLSVGSSKDDWGVVAVGFGIGASIGGGQQPQIFISS